MSDAPVDQPATDVLAAEAFGVPAADPVFRAQVAPATDVLAAEEFGVPAPDPLTRSWARPPTDILVAEEFGVPAPDPALRPEALLLPEDLVGGEARDVLAAEEFAMPAPDEARPRPPAVIRKGAPIVRVAAVGVPLLLAARTLVRRSRRRKAQQRRFRAVRRLLRR